MAESNAPCLPADCIKASRQLIVNAMHEAGPFQWKLSQSIILPAPNRHGKKEGE